jgi:hypothetical protein
MLRSLEKTLVDLETTGMVNLAINQGSPAPMPQRGADKMA